MYAFAITFAWAMIGLWVFVSIIADREQRNAIRNSQRIVK